MAPTAMQNAYMSLLKWGVLQSRVGQVEDMEAPLRLVDLILRNRIGTVLYRYFNAEVRQPKPSTLNPTPYTLHQHLKS